MKATNGRGSLVEIPNCTIAIPGAKIIRLKAIPDLSDSKQTAYNDDPIIGRSFPLKTFSHSENRAISLTLHFYIVENADVADRLSDLRALQSALYPREDSSGVPFIPPPVCQIRCGKLLGDGPLCAVLKQYSFKVPIDVVWTEIDGTYLPLKFDVETQWDTIYRSDQLPGQEKIFKSGV